MSTPCMIGKRNQDGTITAIYCNFDGYPTRVGLTLAARYTDPMKVDRLLELGDIWSLGNEPVDVITPIVAALGCKYPFEMVYQGKLDEKTVDELWDMYTRRITGKGERKAQTYDSLDALIYDTPTGYQYVLDAGKWRVHDGESGRRWVSLATAARHEIMMSMPEDRRHDAVEECKTAGVTVTLQA